MFELIRNIFEKKQRLDTRGFFPKNRSIESPGFIKGQVKIGIPHAITPFDVTFKIDTASCYTLLLDNDFLTACKVLGWRPYRDSAVLNWIRTHPVFFRDEGRANSVGGRTNSIYRINYSQLLYYQTDKMVIDRWKPEVTPVYGAFSMGFSEGVSRTHVSLLGIEHLNRLRQFLWSWPRLAIEFMH